MDSDIPSLRISATPFYSETDLEVIVTMKYSISVVIPSLVLAITLLGLSVIWRGESSLTIRSGSPETHYKLVIGSGASAD